jgi:pyruvate/2-oxoglutarate dehydrogenase complex dihydrolipoamide dehydrogenase (E3) component
LPVSAALSWLDRPDAAEGLLQPKRHAPSPLPWRAAEPLTNIEALELDRLPEHLVIRGGGYVGLELAQAYRRFGSRVTIIEQRERVAGREDPDVSAEVQRILEATPDGAVTIEGTDILVAAGRTPNTAGIGLGTAGIELTDRGYVRVSSRLEATAPGTWAIGECAGSPQFTHISLDDFRVIRDNLAGGNRTTTGRLVPYCMFMDAPLARVGLNEREAREAGVAVRVAKLPASAVLRTRTTGQSDGFLKALVGDDDRVLGFTMIGTEAGEVMAVVQMAMMARMPYTGLRDAILTHPTMAEGLNALLGRVHGRS